ncbi:hypothetical protein HDU91_006001 [Kappamyces sp. JEL0680]|nr:hypothetical protein HDU91_006001 [Kappamyces sp. JEL0680]
MQSLFLAAACLSLVSSRYAGPIKNVVHIMFENRAFDTVLGYVDHNPDIDNLIGKTVCNRANAADPNSKQYCAKPQQVGFTHYGPDHSVRSTAEQIFGVTSTATQFPAPMNGFVQNALNSNSYDAAHVQQIMDGFDPKDIPIWATLAKEFMVADRWFSSVPGPTQPNRAFSHSGTSHGVVTSNAQDVVSGFPQKNVIDVLMAKNKTWSSYYLEMPTLLIMQDLQDYLIPDETAKNLSTDFLKDCANGRLPQYAHLDPYYGDFAGSVDPNLNTTALRSDGSSANGLFGRAEALLKDVYEAVRASPQWNETLLIVTFDEHGG